MLFKTRNSFLKVGIITICILIAAYICFFQLGKSPLENWDEAWYADVVRNMIRSGEYVVMYWNKVIFLDKPPLYMWLTIPIVKLFGMKEFSFRFISAISGLLTIIIIFLSSNNLYGMIPALIAFSTLALNNIYIWRVRSGNLDSLLTFLFVLTYFFMIRKGKIKYVILGLLFGLIYLTKLNIVLIPFGIFFFIEIIYKNKNMVPKSYLYFIMVFLFLVLSGFWLYIGVQKVGMAYFNYFIHQGDQGVSNINLFHFKKDYIDYMYYSLQRRFFWLVLLGGFFALIKIKDKKYLAQLLFAFSLVILLSFTGRNNNWYLLPSMPFWSMLAALATYNIFNILKFTKFRYVVIILFIVLSTYISYKTFNVNIQSIFDTPGPYKLKDSSLAMNKLSSKDDIIIRLDQLYPSSVYYSERKIYSSPNGMTTSDGLFMRRDDLNKKILNKQIQWIFGKQEDVNAFLADKNKGMFKLIKVNDEESILYVIPESSRKKE